MARVLIVDDVRFISQMLASIFEAQGHSVQIAGDGAQALATSRSWLPELILMDVSMPDMDGLEVARELKSDPKTALIPIMMVTSRNDPESLTRAREVGVDEYMLKPFETENLLKKSMTLLGGFPMHYSLELFGSVPVLTLLLDELSGEALQHLRPALSAARNSGAGTILLNVTKAQRVDATAADEILAFVDEYRPAGGTLEVIHPKRGMGVRALAGRLTEKTPLHVNLEEALETHGVLNEQPQLVRLGQASTASASESEDSAAEPSAELSLAPTPTGSATATAPTATAPTATAPAATAPAGTVPAATAPAGTVPAATAPAATAPGNAAAKSAAPAAHVASTAPAGATATGPRRGPTKTATAKGIIVETHPKATIVRVSRERLGDDFFVLLAEEVAREGAPSILLEFRELQAMDATEGRALAALADKATAAGRSLRIVNPHDGVADALGKVNLSSIILRTRQGTGA